MAPRIIAALTMMGDDTTTRELALLQAALGTDMGPKTLELAHKLSQECNLSLETLEALLAAAAAIRDDARMVSILHSFDDPRVAPTLAHLADHGSEEVAREAVIALGDLAHPTALPYLQRIARTHPAIDARINAIFGLSRLGDIETLQAVAATEANQDVRQTACRELDNARYVHEIKADLDGLRDELAGARRWERIIQLLKLVAAVGDSRHVDAVITRLAHVNARIRLVAVRTLAALGGDQAEPHLAQVAQNDEALLVRDVAAALLERAS